MTSNARWGCSPRRQSPSAGPDAAVAELLDGVPDRVLAVYAHPDDPDVSCGGTLARWAGGGAEVHVADLHQR